MELGAPALMAKGAAIMNAIVPAKYTRATMH